MEKNNGILRNKESIESLIARLKLAVDKKDTATINFSVRVKNGFIEQIEWQTEFIRYYDFA